MPVQKELYLEKTAKKEYNIFNKKVREKFNANVRKYKPQKGYGFF